MKRELESEGPAEGSGYDPTMSLSRKVSQQILSSTGSITLVRQPGVAGTWGQKKAGRKESHIRGAGFKRYKKAAQTFRREANSGRARGHAQSTAEPKGRRLLENNREAQQVMRFGGNAGHSAERTVAT